MSYSPTYPAPTTQVQQSIFARNLTYSLQQIFLTVMGAMVEGDGKLEIWDRAMHDNIVLLGRRLPRAKTSPDKYLPPGNELRSARLGCLSSTTCRASRLV